MINKPKSQEKTLKLSDDKFALLRKKKVHLIDKRKYYEHKLSSFRNLKNRSECPNCYQKVNYEDFVNEIPILEMDLKLIILELELVILKMRG